VGFSGFFSRLFLARKGAKKGIFKKHATQNATPGVGSPLVLPKACVILEFEILPDFLDSLGFFYKRALECLHFVYFDFLIFLIFRFF
jgi:hypothetical protein